MADHYRKRIQSLSCHFKNYEIYKDKQLGFGSFGAVYRAKCGRLPCAAKVLHPAFFTSNDPGSKKFLQQFEKECNMLHHIKHPNIVLDLGVFADQTSGMPVLLMELLDESLTKFLKRQETPLLSRLQVDLSSDIIQAITYLHANEICHRDLSSNNVLISGGRHAKVSDLGMSAIMEATTHLTVCPGAVLYMPPEALDKPCYTKKLDCFSFGVLVIQIATGLYPEPANRFSDPLFPVPESPNGTMKVMVAEKERRKTHIELIDPNHPLLPIALKCLNDEKDRPSAEDICEAVSQCSRSEQSMQEECTASCKPPDILERKLAQKAQELREKDQIIAQIIAGKDQIIAHIIEEKDQIIDQKEREIRKLRRDNDNKEGELQELLIADAMKEPRHQTPQAAHAESTRLEETDETCHVKSKHHRSKHQENAHGKIELSWSTSSGEITPQQDMNLGMCTVDSDNNVAYFKVGKEDTLYEYKAPTEEWEPLPQCNRKAYSLAVVDGLLTAVGGLDSNNEELGSLLSLTGRGKMRKWVDKKLDMPNTKYDMACVYCEFESKKLLIVAGGRSHAMPSKTVEVLSLDKKQWYSASELPKAFSEGSAIICGDRLYLVGFLDDHCMDTVAYTCSLSDLCPQAGLFQSLLMQTFPPLMGPSLRIQWRKIANLQLKLATCVSFMGKLVALGGMDNDKQPSDAIYAYNSADNKWERDVFSPLPSARYSCLALALPQNKLMIVGGQLGTPNEPVTNAVEFAVVSRSHTS